MRAALADLDTIGNTAHVQAASVVGVLKGTKTKAGTRKVELNSEALAALQAQKQYTFMKSEFIFSDPKTGNPGRTPTLSVKKHGCRPDKSWRALP